MQSKSLLIAIAAFAVTATGVHAYGGPKILNRAGLSEDQVSAIEEAQELRMNGKLEEARDKLLSAGVDEEALLSIRKATNESKDAMREALKSDDYIAFKDAVADSPLRDIITSEEDFEQFREAHELRIAGEWEEAHTILDDLGVSVNDKDSYHRAKRTHFLNDLTDEQREALMVARQANDRATIQAIYDEAGSDYGYHPELKW